MDTSLLLPPTGLDSAQSVRAQALAAPREGEGARALAPERQTPALSAQVNISDAAHAALRSDPPPMRPPGSETAMPVQTSEAVVRADGAKDRDAAAATASQEAVKRYLENAPPRPAGQAEPSTVRISA